MRWGMPPSLKTRGPPVTNIRKPRRRIGLVGLSRKPPWRALLSVVDPTEQSTFVRAFVNSRAFIEGSGRPDILAIGEGLKSPLLRKQAMQARRWRMLLDSEKANEMQAAVDAVFARLPKTFKTKETRIEIAKNVVRSEDRSE